MRNRMNRMKVRTDSELIEEAHLYKQPILNLILAALLDSPFLGSGQNKPRLNNDDVLKLVANGLSEKVVVHVIELYEGDFDTTRAGLLSLRKHGVGDRVIETMQSKEFKATASDVSATVQESAA